MRDMVGRPWPMTVLVVAALSLAGCPRRDSEAPAPSTRPSPAVEQKATEPEPIWGGVCKAKGERLIWVSAADPSDQRTLVTSSEGTHLGDVVVSPDHRKVGWVTGDLALDLVDLPSGQTTRVGEAYGADAASISRGAMAWDPAVERLAHVDKGDICITATGGETVWLTHTGDVTDLAWSPDGRQIAYGRHDMTIYDDRGLWLVDAAGGEPRRLVEPTGDVFSAVGPCWSPDGSVIAFVHAWEGAVLGFVSPDGTRKETGVTASYPGPRWLPDSSAVLCGDGFYEEEPTALFRCPPFGKPEKLLDGRIHALDVSADGKLAIGIAQGDMMSRQRDATIRLLSLDTLEEEWSASLPGWPSDCRFRPDGPEFAVLQRNVPGEATLYICEAGGEPRLIVDGIWEFYGWAHAG